ncbi:NAD(P)-dependent oxidoreductase [Thermomicrobium sp.]|jgi:NAD+ dependent glucose-6-phosphate dehydrogenase|uniref:NAD-dependent epimerase/dehydratase family protein n=1 Tax=Thermomicrobium sp. TaxID=1969469 RepID=UPI001B028751|nr:NAD(P)-dependent oxidoreductase [Thermomicrobium sp.]MBO9308024.1 NAD(P)-dependent oxidoreductase [Thermomicrobium sp.]
MQPRRVLITGAGGRIGQSLVNALRSRYDLRLHFHRVVPPEFTAFEHVVADIAQYTEVESMMRGIDAVVHLAADPRVTAPWESVLLNNIVGTYNVFEAARRCAVRKIVFASTNHVMGMYDRDRMWPVYSWLPPRPDSLYGVSKAFGELLGRYYSDRFGMSVICLRIGWFLPEPTDQIARWMWLSPRDCAQIMIRALETDLLYGVFYAISGNSSRHWDITDAMERLGYRPQDDAEQFFRDEGT